MDFIVEYTVAAGKETEAEEVRRAFFAELADNPDPGYTYRSLCRPDGRTFVHLAWFADEDAQARFTGLPGFASFGGGLRAVSSDGPNAMPLQLMHTTEA